jgi:EAL domain-containing protein (putative c-di-GMP-specific phosphodiesterase class I)
MGLDGSYGRADVERRWVLALGIDNLGTLEELFGEELGDEVIATAGRRLARAIPIGAELCATRHRRFLVEIRGLGAGSVTALFARLQAALDGAIETSSGPVAVTLSGGCALAGPEGWPNMAERAAVHALHAAMARGAGSFRIAGEDRALLEWRARAALAAGADGDIVDPVEGRLAVAFQPVIRASGGNTIAFHECLARIPGQNGDLISAAEFMPSVERLGLAPFLDRQVIRIALDTLARHPGVRLSVNILPQTMQDAAWMAIFDQAIARDPTLAERLIVEVSESCAMHQPRRTLSFMDCLREQGVAFALDDFGAGHNSLRYLRDFRFDLVKIDGRFVRGIRAGSDDAFCVARLVEIAHHFDMMTVAGTIQGPAEGRCLSDLGVEYFQGFYFGSPSLVLGPTPTPMPAVAAQA